MLKTIEDVEEFVRSIELNYAAPISKKGNQAIICRAVCDKLRIGESGSPTAKPRTMAAGRGK